MPDKYGYPRGTCLEVLIVPLNRWEYPFFAAWDTAFHCIPLAVVDPTFAKKQLDLLTREWYMKPDGQIPAYEWNFSDVNPPVHAWYVVVCKQICCCLIPFSLGRHSECTRLNGSSSEQRMFVSLNVFSRSYFLISRGMFGLRAFQLSSYPQFVFRWVNRKDQGGNNVFEGGFLGLDNIGVFNRSEPLPTGGTLRQADGTAWMAFYCLNM